MMVSPAFKPACCAGRPGATDADHHRLGGIAQHAAKGCGSLATLVVIKLAVAIDRDRFGVPGRGKRELQRHAIPGRIL